ncbi:ester cyclase [Zobellella maritima]|uniref:ester cyclase n=1 Tax=Zobellella maritima TaxID=2059725 RepID=UPI000E30588D|nr:ester cyclase [Zobellella maritima]
MNLDIHCHNKTIINRFRAALYDCDPGTLREQLHELFASDCKVQLAHPLGEVTGPDGLYQVGYAPLMAAIPDLERRDYIVLAGPDEEHNWVGCGGFYTGVFEQSWLDIPATRLLVTLRYAEFFRIEDDRIVEMVALWDIPELMMQARAWPMGPSLGRELLVPGPAVQDGIVTAPYNAAQAAASFRLVDNMLNGLQEHAVGGEKAMGLERYWHPKMVWYGPAGIGSCRRISGFRNWHQIPFLAGMPDRVSCLGKHERKAYFADANYVAYCGWPGLNATISGDGWLGIAPSGQKVTIRSLDFWRIENDKIRENWVLVDLLDVYHQVGVDVLARMRALTHDRQAAPPLL